MNDRCGSVLALGCALFMATSCAPKGQTPSAKAERFSKINHVVVLYLENRSFDNLYGEFPGADGLQGLKPSQYVQTDTLGQPYRTLPQVATSHIPNGLPNAPFAIDKYIPNDMPTQDLVHRYYQEQLQINGVKMDRFVAISNAKGF